MVYGGPCYAKNNIIEAGFSNQKHFIGVYILKQSIFKEYIGELKNAKYGKGVIKFTKTGDIDFAVVQKMLNATFDSPDIVCG